MTSNSTVLIRVVSMSMVEHEDAAEHAAATSVDSSNEIEHRGSAATWLDVIANTATAQATKTVIMRMANPIVLCQKLKRARSSVEAGSGLFLFSARFSKFVFVWFDRFNFFEESAESKSLKSLNGGASTRTSINTRTLRVLVPLKMEPQQNLNERKRRRVTFHPGTKDPIPMKDRVGKEDNVLQAGTYSAHGNIV